MTSHMIFGGNYWLDSFSEDRIVWKLKNNKSLRKTVICNLDRNQYEGITSLFQQNYPSPLHPSINYPQILPLIAWKPPNRKIFENHNEKETHKIKYPINYQWESLNGSDSLQHIGEKNRNRGPCCQLVCFNHNKTSFLPIIPLKSSFREIFSLVVVDDDSDDDDDDDDDAEWVKIVYYARLYHDYYSIYSKQAVSQSVVILIISGATTTALPPPLQLSKLSSL